MDDTWIFECRLAEILRERGMNQKELAKICELHPTTISELVNNTRKAVNREHVGIVAKALDLRVEELIRFVPAKRTVPKKKSE